MPNKSPGPQIKDKDQYEALRDKGYSKEKSARIANSKGAEKRGGHAKKYEDNHVAYRRLKALLILQSHVQKAR